MRDINKIKQDYEEGWKKDLAELVAIPSYNTTPTPNLPFGQACDDILTYALNWWKENGADKIYRDHENYYGFADFGICAHILGVMSHLDVAEPGDPKGWSKNPFMQIYERGYLYGRGASDTKGPNIAIMYALKILKSEGYNLDSARVRIIFGLNDEYYMKSLLKYKNDFGTPDLGTIVSEPVHSLALKQKGKVAFDVSANVAAPFDFIVHGGRDYNMVCDKVDVTFLNLALKTEYFEMLKIQQIKFSESNNVVSVYGSPSHASLPEMGVNAISKMALVFKKNNYRENDLINFINDYIRDDYNLKHIYHDTKDETGRFTINLGFITINAQQQRLGIDVRLPGAIDVDAYLKSVIDFIVPYKLAYREVFKLYPVIHEKNTYTLGILELVKKYSVDEVTDFAYLGGVSYSNIFDNAYTVGVSQDLTKIASEIIATKGNFIPHSYIMSVIVSRTLHRTLPFTLNLLNICSRITIKYRICGIQ